MKRNFKAKVRNVACVQPGLLDTIYKELALDESKEAHPAENSHDIFGRNWTIT